jgi:hypothetical protein
VDVASFVDPNANPTLHQMVAEMISNRVSVTADEKDTTIRDAAVAADEAGFRAATEVSGNHALIMNADLD